MDGKNEKKKEKRKDLKGEEKEKQTRKRKGKKSMIKKIISIFIYIVLTGCDTLTGPETANTYLEVSAPSLSQDENGYYIMYVNDNFQQTFTTLKAETGSETIQLLTWDSNKEFSIEWQGQLIWENVVNGSSYTDDEGNGYTVLGVYDIFVGDTITIYCGYEDDYNNYYQDYLEVIINE